MLGSAYMRTGVRAGVTPRPMSLHAFFALPDDGRRHELIDGIHYVSPSPALRHQWICGRVSRVLEDYFAGPRRARVFGSPVDVELSTRDVMVPDVIVVPWETDLAAQRVEQPPKLVVEVLSPSSRNRDRQLKFERYAAFGVPHYWIIDPDQPSFACYRLQNGHFERAAGADPASPMLVHPDFTGLEISLSALA